MRRVAVVAVAQTKHKRHIAEPEEMVIDHHTNRNMPAFQLYQERTNARGCADIVIDNNDPANPEILSQ